MPNEREATPSDAALTRLICVLGEERKAGLVAKAIATARAELDFDLWAYVFMPEHVHLIVRPRRPS